MIVVAAVASTFPVVAFAAGTLTLEAAQTPPSDCAPVEVDLTATDPASGLGFDFRIAYDPALVDVSNVSLASGTQECLYSFNDPDDPNEPDYGFVTIAIACPNEITVPGASLATLTVEPVSNGTAALNFSDCSVNEQECDGQSPGSVQVSCFAAPDNCPYADNPGQEDRGGVGPGSVPDGIGDACQCGDVNGSGGVTVADSVIVLRSRLVPPTATLTVPDLCDVGGPTGCSQTDSVIILRSLLTPPTATVMQQCAPANPPAATISRRLARSISSGVPVVSLSRSRVTVGETASIDIVIDPMGTSLAAAVLTLQVNAGGLRIVDVDAEPGIVMSSDNLASVFSFGVAFADDRMAPFKVATVTVEASAVGGALELLSQSFTFGDFTETRTDAATTVVVVDDGIDATPGATPEPNATPGTLCVADCDGDGQVTVDELTKLVDLALKGKSPDGCIAADRNFDGEITVDEISAAISTALGGCSR